MPNPARQLLEEIRDELHELRRIEEQRRQVEDGTPLSRSALCRILGIDIRTTLEPLIKAKKIKTVPWTRGEVRIPVAELRRLQREGIPQLEQKPKAPPASTKSQATVDAAGAAENIRKLKIK
jgi:hypothetical protein